MQATAVLLAKMFYRSGASVNQRCANNSLYKQIQNKTSTQSRGTRSTFGVEGNRKYLEGGKEGRAQSPAGTQVTVIHF